MDYSIICTGSSGLVADHFKKSCQKKNLAFYGLDLHGEGKSVDITNYEQLKTAVQKLVFKLENPILFHFAAITLTGKNLSQEQIDLSQRVNVDGTYNVVKVCHDFNLPLVHISTDFVFSGIDQKKSFKSSDKTKADETVYAKTKEEAEKIVLQNKNRQQVNIIRIAFPYGNFTHPKLGLARKFIKWLDEKKEVSFYTKQTICPTPIAYISKACVKVAELIADKKIKSGKILHVVGQAITPYKFATLIKQIWEKNTLINKSKMEKGCKNLVLDTKETEEILGMKLGSHRKELKKLHTDYS